MSQLVRIVVCVMCAMLGVALGGGGALTEETAIKGKKSLESQSSS